MSIVSQKKVDDLRANIEKNFPNFELLYKDDADWYKQAWYLWVIWAFFRVIGLFAPKIRDQFDTRYSNGLYSKMVLSSRKRHEDWTSPRTYRLVLHEYRHMLDMKKHPIWMALSYIMVLPAIFTMRSHWELRGFTAEMIGYYEVYGEIPDELIEGYVGSFTGAMYVWMLPFPSWVRKKLKARREDIYAGKITGMDW